MVGLWDEVGVHYTSGWVPVRVPLAFTVLLLILASTAAAAQMSDDSVFGQIVPPLQNPNSAHEESALKFKSQTVLIQVPTVVTDKSGNHIHSLRKEDFKILENGKQQQISTFEEVMGSGWHQISSPNPPDTFSNLTFDPRKASSITVIVLDSINTPFLDQAYARKALITYLGNNLGSGQALVILAIGSKGVKVLGGLNSDPASLITALKKAGGEAPAMQKIGSEAQMEAALGNITNELKGPIGINDDPLRKTLQFILQADSFEAGYRQSRAMADTMKAFLDIALSFSGIPGRKSLIWATGGFPFSLYSPASLPGGGLALLYERMMQALNDAQISVYPVDVRGILRTSPGDDPTYSQSAGGDVFGLEIAGRSALQQSTVDSLQTFAEMTGGRAFFNNNDAAAGFQRAADDSASYYLLGYYLNTRNTHSGWRKLQVQVQRKDVEVRARSGFFVTKATIDPEITHQGDVSFAFNSPFDSTGIPVTMQWQGMVPDGKKRKVGFALRVPATGIIDESDKNRFDVDFLAQATENGKPAGNTGQTVKGTLPPDALAKIKAEGIFYKNVFELAPGDYEVRFVVRDNLTAKIGSVSAPLAVK